jgi:Ca2+-binding EF-hand superfamily protein
MQADGKRPASYSLFYRFFNEFDTNGDGVLSQQEMTMFVKKFMDIKPSEDDEIMDIVDEIWIKFDTDRSGKLNRRETFKFLNAFM